MDNINLINRKCIEELFSIYKEVKLLFVKDDTFSYNSIIEDILSHIKEEKFSYEIYEIKDIIYAYDILKIKKTKFNLFIGTGIGATILFSLLDVQPFFAINPVLDIKNYCKTNFDNDEKLQAKLECIVEKIYDKKSDSYSFNKFYLHVDKVCFFKGYKDFLITKEFREIDKRKLNTFLCVEYGIHEIYSDKEESIKSFSEELIDFIKRESFDKEEEKEAKIVYGSMVTRSDTWDKDWLPFILYDKQWDGYYLYNLISHKLNLMLKYFSSYEGLLLNKKEKSRRINTLSRAIMLLNSASEKSGVFSIQDVVEGELGLKETYVVYDKKYYCPIYCAYLYENKYLDSMHKDYVSLDRIEQILGKYQGKQYVIEKYNPQKTNLICVYDIEKKTNNAIEIIYGNKNNFMWSTRHKKPLGLKCVSKCLKRYSNTNRYKVEYDNFESISYVMINEIYEKRKQYLIDLAFSYIAKNIEYWFD